MSKRNNFKDSSSDCWIWEFTSLRSQHKRKKTFIPKAESMVLKKLVSGGGSPCIMAELGRQEAWYALRKWNGLASLLVCYAAWPHEYEREIVSAQRSRPYCTRSITDQNRAEESRAVWRAQAGVTQPGTLDNQSFRVSHDCHNPSFSQRAELAEDSPSCHVFLYACKMESFWFCRNFIIHN